MARPRLGRVLGGRRIGIDTNEYTRRRERLGELLARRGLDAIFVPPGSDLEYLTGIERDLPSFGHISYAHGWVAGAFLAPGTRAGLRAAADGRRLPPRRRARRRGTIVVEDDGDGRASSPRRSRELGSPDADRTRAAGLGGDGGRAARSRARTPARRGLVARERAAARQVARRARADGAGLPDRARDDGRDRRRTSSRASSMTDLVEARRARAARARLALPLLPDAHLHLGRAPARLRRRRTPREPLREGEVVLFDFGAVWQGYCSDFGRTVACGEPPAGLRAR